MANKVDPDTPPGGATDRQADTVKIRQLSRSRSDAWPSRIAALHTCGPAIRRHPGNPLHGILATYGATPLPFTTPSLT